MRIEEVPAACRGTCGSRLTTGPVEDRDPTHRLVSIDLREQARRWLPVILWMGLIFVGSAQPQANVPSHPIFLVDFAIKKLFHVVEYAILTLLLIRALRPQPKRYVLALIIAVLYAITDEYHQSFVPGRSASAYDVLIDSVGALLAILTVRSRGRWVPVLRKHLFWAGWLNGR